MYKRSVIIVLIQTTGIILGFVSIYFVAGDMVPEVYSLVGVYTIISSITLVFSNLGIETTMMREALYWMKQGKSEKVVQYTTQSILSRFIGFALLLPILFGYLTYLNITKYDGQYTLLFVSFFIGSCLNTLNDSMSLLIRSQGGFVFSQFAKTFNADIMKFIAILVYVKFGSMPYLYFYALYSIPLMLIFVVKLGPFLSLKYVRISDTVSHIKEAKYLFLRSYLDYFKTHADAILVSFIFPAGIMGSYSILKNFENIVRSFEDGFFDVLSQNAVKYKGDYDSLCKEERKYNIARVAVIGLIVAGALVFTINPQFFVELMHLSQYEGIVSIIYCVLGVAFCYLLGKYEITALSLLATSRLNFNIGIAGFIFTLVSFFCVVIMHSLEGILIQRIFVNLAIAVLGIYLFRIDRKKYYTQILT